jgi:hypothetical protein
MTCEHRLKELDFVGGFRANQNLSDDLSGLAEHVFFRRCRTTIKTARSLMNCASVEGPRNFQPIAGPVLPFGQNAGGVSVVI